MYSTMWQHGTPGPHPLHGDLSRGLRLILGALLGCVLVCSSRGEPVERLYQPSAWLVGSNVSGGGLLDADVARCSVECVAREGCSAFLYGGPGACCPSLTHTGLPYHTWSLYTPNNKPVAFLVRRDGSEDFERSWAEYREGFGSLLGEYWLGLEALHRLTALYPAALHVEMDDWAGATYWAEYANFSVGDEADYYRMYVTGYNPASTAGDGLTNMTRPAARRLHGAAFSTYDADHDNFDDDNCATMFPGGWWNNACYIAKATGLYVPGGVENWAGINWEPVFGNYYSFKTFTMSVKLQH